MKHLINENALELMPYKAGRPVEDIKREYNLEKVIKLASNENPFPVPDNVVKAITREIANINTYPDSDSYYLRHEIARYNNVDPANVIIGSGSVECIRMIIKAFLKPGETVLTSESTFVFYKIATIEAAGKNAYVEVPMTDSYHFDLDAMAQKIDDSTKIIFLTNPNNPTGTALGKKAVLDFIAKVPEDKLIVLDNAYHEYVDDLDDYPDGIREAVNSKNIIVLRTFSKIYALSGLRIGYAIANKEIIGYLGRVKAPFNVTRIAQVAAVASLENDDFKNKSASLNRENRIILQKQLEDLGLKVIPSQTNFLLFFPEVDIDELNNRLLKAGVIIRPLAAFGVPDGMRVTVAFKEDNDFFIENLKRILEEMR